MEKSDCIGCEDDFYNGKNDLQVKECFRFRGKGNRVKKRYRIDYNTPTHHKEAYQEIKCPTCYRRKGWAYIEKIPGYAVSKHHDTRILHGETGCRKTQSDTWPYQKSYPSGETRSHKAERRKRLAYSP